MSKHKLTVSVVIPNYNGEKLLESNLPKIFIAKKMIKNNIKEIIVVDDGSQDNSISLLKDKFQEVRIIRHKKHRGYSSSVNTGVRASRGDIILLLSANMVPEKDSLVYALPHFDDENVFAVSLHQSGYGWAKGGFKDGYVQLVQGGELEGTHSSFYVNGNSGLFRRSSWIEMGGIDEKLFSPHGWEDIDISYRASKRGYTLLWEPKSKVLCDHSQGFDKYSNINIENITERNQLLFIWKNIHSLNLLKKHLVQMSLKVVRRLGYLKIVFMALAKIGIVLEKRKKEIKEAIVSDEAIFARFL